MNAAQSSLDPTLLDPTLRQVVATADAAYRPYARYGIARDDMEYLPIAKSDTSAGDTEAVREVFLLRFKPGAVSTPHCHEGSEEFYVLDGELTDCDGRVFGRGDYVSYAPGSRHASSSENGCTLLVILTGPNRAI